MENLIQKLQDQDHKKAYELTKMISALSAETDAYYSYFEDFLSLISAKSSYVRTRGFILCCAQARWDTEGKLEKYLPSMLVLLQDPKPTVIRQCLAALHEVVLFHPGLSETILTEIQRMDLRCYKESMVSLIQKDLYELKKLID